MPIYKFRCDKCGHEFEDLVPNRGDKSPCPECGSKKVSRMVSMPAKRAPGSSSDSSSCSTGTCSLPSWSPRSN
jgi:putative FmdB family regulatory protein